MVKTSRDIFDGGSDSDNEIKSENQYAKNYNDWRKKEELNKLKTKYGENVLDNSESSSSDDDEDAVELTKEVERDFYTALSYLKKKDPQIYDSNVSFFKTNEVSSKTKKIKEQQQPMYIKDYERKLLLEMGGILSDGDEEPNSRIPTYVKEQEQIKDELVKIGAKVESDEEEEGTLGGLLALRKKTKEEENTNETEYCKWLAGQTEEIEDNEIKSALKPLKDFWNDPNLDKGEKFLRDYVLNKRYLENADEGYIPTYDEIIHDSDTSLSGDEEEIEKQEEFEHKYNYRFEEPDQEFIKRYPRTIEQSLRKVDNKRKIKRAETKERKKLEKEEKMAEIKKLQELKKKEIEEKLEKLKEVTGGTDLAFQDDDIDGDFDPDAYDKRMQALFNDDFYKGEETDQKPKFPDIDEELEIENWEYWKGEENNEGEGEQYQPHCEDDNFNMDADYDPSSVTRNDLIENSKGKKKRKRKSKVAEALSRPKPKFDPNDKNYEKYFDEYYKLDCEDIIGDIPCRFKYREVVPNDFGLTVEEILLAKDKELNRWCSLKKTIQRRPENIEKYDQIAYAKKSNNIILKQRLLPSLFSTEADDSEALSSSTSKANTNSRETNIISLNQQNNNSDEVKTEQEKTNTTGKKKNVLNGKEQTNNNTSLTEEINQNEKEEISSTSSKKKKKKKRRKVIENKNKLQGFEGVNMNKKKNEEQTLYGKKQTNKNTSLNEEINQNEKEEISSPSSKKKKNKKRRKVIDNKNKLQGSGVNLNKRKNEEQTSDSKKNKKRKVDQTENSNQQRIRKAKKSEKPVNIGISDARLSAFGINPKKYKNKLKYGNKSKK